MVKHTNEHISPSKGILVDDRVIMELKINAQFSRITWRCDDDDDDDDDDDGDDDYDDDDFSRGRLELLGGVALMSGGAALLCVGGEDPTLFTGLL